MSEDPSKHPSYMVHWKVRVLTPDKRITPALISQIRKGGISIDFNQMLAIGTEVLVEFHVKYKNELTRLRAKTQVQSCILKSNQAPIIHTIIKKMDSHDVHTFNNILQTLSESKEVNLRI
ncbi:MAG: hypothetical protein COA42_20295 [Alteromonadaceae bacterium]|nr:MAG: hypothetical protein COA42_20295 [Alteromonadaceae bacterium]